MKYGVGNNVLLYDGRSVYIYQVDEKARKYFVIDTTDDKSNFLVSDSEIYCLIT